MEEFCLLFLSSCQQTDSTDLPPSAGLGDRQVRWGDTAVILESSTGAFFYPLIVIKAKQLRPLISRLIRDSLWQLLLMFTNLHLICLDTLFFLKMQEGITEACVGKMILSD